jgi:hypothetical protein
MPPARRPSQSDRRNLTARSRRVAAEVLIRTADRRHPSGTRTYSMRRFRRMSSAGLQGRGDRFPAATRVQRGHRPHRPFRPLVLHPTRCRRRRPSRAVRAEPSPRERESVDAGGGLRPNTVGRVRPHLDARQKFCTKRTAQLVPHRPAPCSPRPWSSAGPGGTRAGFTAECRVDVLQRRHARVHGQLYVDLRSIDVLALLRSLARHGRA